MIKVPEPKPRNFFQCSTSIRLNVKASPKTISGRTSNAAFKVGLSEPESNNYPFDLMMEIKKPVDIDNYLNQIIHYLEMIKDETDKKVDK